MTLLFSLLAIPMKTLHRHLVSALLFSTLMVFSASGADSSEPTGEKIPPQRVDVKVLKVFTAQEEAIFRAYLVKWKDQEVIVSDPLAQTNHQEGDSISVLVMNHPFPRGKESHRLLVFTITPSRR